MQPALHGDALGEEADEGSPPGPVLPAHARGVAPQPAGLHVAGHGVLHQPGDRKAQVGHPLAQTRRHNEVAQGQRRGEGLGEGAEHGDPPLGVQGEQGRVGRAQLGVVVVLDDEGSGAGGRLQQGETARGGHLGPGGELVVGRDQENIGRGACGTGAHARGVGAHRLKPPPHGAGHLPQGVVPGILHGEAAGAAVGGQDEPQAVAGAGGDDDVARIDAYGPGQAHVLGDEGAQAFRAQGRVRGRAGGRRPPGAAPQGRRQRARGRGARPQVASEGGAAHTGIRVRGRRGGHPQRGVHPGAAGARHKEALARQLLVGADDAAPRDPQLARQDARGGQRVPRRETGVGDAAADVLDDLDGDGAAAFDLHGCCLPRAGRASACPRGGPKERPGTGLQGSPPLGAASRP